jgi:small conductance mechanosensitive channel
MFNGNYEIVMFLIRLGLAVLTIFVGRWLAWRVRAWVRRGMVRTKLTGSMKLLFERSAYYGTLLLGVLVALAVAGVPPTAIVAAVGVVVIILGIALQEALSDFASAVIFLVFQPFKVGDLVETNGITGTIIEIQFFSTILLRADQKVVVIPNGNIRKSNLINYSEKQVLRVDLEVMLTYASDLLKAKRVAAEVLAADVRVLVDPPPLIVVLDLEENGVKLGIRPYAAREDYWLLLWDLWEQIKLRFEAEGLTFAVPQRTVQIVAAPAEKAITTEATS